MKPVEAYHNDIFSVIYDVEIPQNIPTDPQSGLSRPFIIRFKANGNIPFPQVVIRSKNGEHIFNGDKIQYENNLYSVKIPERELPAGSWAVQVEGCRKENWITAGGDDWIKWFGQVTIEQVAQERTRSTNVSIATRGKSTGVKLYFGIHKHMHQPYYRAADTSFWDGEKDGIFGSRCGNYSRFIPDAVKHYLNGDLPHAGVSTSWSGSLIEQLIRCEKEGLCSGCFKNWNSALREISNIKTSLGNPRVNFTAFGFFHPLMPLIPKRDIIRQIALHREIINSAFGVDASDILFPPETAFHVRMIPALLECGVKAVIYDSIHRYRACKDYPYAGINEGMLPPNPADQRNPAVNDWVQLNNVWAGSKISPSLLKPEYIQYEGPDGTVYKIIGVPAERYIGNEDARGGFGALQYGDILGQVYDNICKHNTFDPKHPPFFLLHSDGDNHGGGADSYYHSNTEQLVRWIKTDPRFELITIDDYLQQFPPDPLKSVHIEPGSWSGADNGDPQFRKWFSRYEQTYSPDLNSWAVLTALQNCVHSAGDADTTNETFSMAERLLLTAETSCYWYWTGQELWDRQVTEAANAAVALLKNKLNNISGKETTPPTIFAPWITPENPGGKTWGQGSLKDAERTATVHTFVYDISGIKSVDLVLRTSQNSIKRLRMISHGTYPSQTNPTLTATYFTVELPQGAGEVSYFIEAKDGRGNTGTTTLERVFLA
jgi:hypothetical protein